MKTILIITLFYFLLGAVLVQRINVRSHSKNQQSLRWIKYVSYLCIVGCMLTGIYFGFFILLSFVICSFAFGEIIDVYAGSQKRSFVHLLISLLILGFLSWSLLRTGFYLSREFHLYLYTLVFCFDGFSQLTGQLIGKTKLVARISPGKTVEGLAGGIATTILTGVLLKDIINVDTLHAVLLAVSIAALALLGDLLASVYKRFHFVKDYNALIPGHGGILDRFDSLVGAGLIGLLINSITA